MLDKNNTENYLHKLSMSLFLDADMMITGKKITKQEYIKILGMREIMVEIISTIKSGRFDIKEKIDD